MLGKVFRVLLRIALVYTFLCGCSGIVVIIMKYHSWTPFELEIMLAPSLLMITGSQSIWYALKGK